jgi:hypothetical protein
MTSKATLAIDLCSTSVLRDDVQFILSTLKRVLLRKTKKHNEKNVLSFSLSFK